MTVMHCAAYCRVSITEEQAECLLLERKTGPQDHKTWFSDVRIGTLWHKGSALELSSVIYFQLSGYLMLS